MTDVFISYKSDDRQIAAAIAAAVSRRGLTSWWDQKLEAGIDADYEKTIRHELNFASCVLVVWTPRSVDSIWVKAEANHGLLRAAILSVIVDGVEPPLPFKMVECLALRSGERFLLDVETIVDSLEGVIRKTRREPIEKPRKGIVGPTTIGTGGSFRRLDVAMDIPDRRDRQFHSLTMAAQPDEFPSSDMWKSVYLSGRRLIPIVQNQRDMAGGAAFGLATVANFTDLRENGLKFSPTKLVSTAMLFHFACLQEGPASDYRGVSCRSALAGWLKNGLCRDGDWPLSSDDDRKSRHKVWKRSALLRPLAGYYRVPTRSIYDIQAALLQLGAVYASVLVHKGWVNIAATARAPAHVGLCPQIPWSTRNKTLGGHAVAIVGYDGNGFLIVNSWGKNWGAGGLAILTYDDWLSNGMDVWGISQASPINLKAIRNVFKKGSSAESLGPVVR